VGAGLEAAQPTLGVVLGDRGQRQRAEHRQRVPDQAAPVLGAVALPHPGQVLDVAQRVLAEGQRRRHGLRGVDRRRLVNALAPRGAAQ
jgi:hypothetical protein